MPAPSITLKGRVVQHNVKAATKDGVDVLKVTLELANAVGGESVPTSATFAMRADDGAADRFPLDEAFEVEIRLPKK